MPKESPPVTTEIEMSFGGGLWVACGMILLVGVGVALGLSLKFSLFVADLLCNVSG